MNEPKSLSDQDMRWIEGFCNGDLSDTAFHDFERALETRPELRAQLRAYLGLDAALRNSIEEPPMARSPEPAHRKTNGILYLFQCPWGWVAAAALAVSLIALSPFFPKRTQIAQVAERSAKGFGVITGLQQCQWDGPTQFEPGDLAPTGPIRLLAGSARVELFSGVTLIIEGDTELAFESAMRLRVRRGQIHASVPEPAHGFLVITPDSQIVDKGTEFALRVGPDNSEAHVLNGEIEWNSDSARKPESLTTGQAVRWSNDQTKESIPADFESFLGVREFNDQLNSDRERRRHQWLAFCETFKRDPRLVAYFPMNPTAEWESNLPNRSPNTGWASDGAIVAAKPTTDRFGRPFGALDFSQAGSRVRLHVKQSLTELTLLAWVRIDSLDRWYNSLLLTDGHELNEPHWQIMNDGRLFFSVKANDPKVNPKLKDKQIVYSPSFWNPALSGKWIQIATTYETQTHTVTHYLNGKPFHQETLENSMRVQTISIGPATIGNWSEPTRNDPKFAIRNLNGSIDDFSIFNTALSPSEIADLYKKGKP